MTGDLLIAWVVAPLVLIALCLGAGLLTNVLVGSPRLGLLTAPIGAAVLIVVATIVTLTSALAPFAVWLMAALAAAGWITWFVRGRGRTLRASTAAVVGALVTFAAFAAPVVMSGEATWAGWLKLDDGASWLAFTDYVLTAGHTVPQPMTSTYDALINVNFASDVWGWFGYPRGAFPLLGAMSGLSGVDAAWLLQPYMAVMAALLSIVVFWMLSRLLGRGWLTAVAAATSSLAATYYAYSLWGGVKEVLLALLLAVLCASAALALGRRLDPRLLVYPAVVAGAILAVTGTSGAGLIAPVALAVGWIAWWQRRPRAAVLGGSALAGAGVTMAVLVASGLVGAAPTIGVEFPDMGNLVAPLSAWQAVGIWPAGDFRFGPELPAVTAVLIGVTVLLAGLGIVHAVTRRQWALPMFTGTSVLMVAYGQYSGDAWLAGKILAAASPSVLAAAFAGVGWLLHESRRVRAASRGVARGGRVAGWAAVALLVGGVVWSNALAYGHVWLAPRDQQAELEAIGTDYRGKGPALMTDYSAYGARYFLRGLDAEGASDLRVNPIPLRDGTSLGKGGGADIDDFPPSTLADYPIFVLRRSPLSSRPPADYRLERSGRYYEVWRRDPARGTVTDGIALQAGAQPGAVPDCQQVLDLASRSDGHLVAAERLPVIEVPVGAPSASGTISAPVVVPQDGTYELWIAGSFPGRLQVGMDGERVFDDAHVIEGDPTAVTSVATIDLTAGDHTLHLTQTTPWLLPGSSAGPFSFGPVYLAREDAGDAALVNVAREDAADLCGRTLDWVQAVRP